MCQKKSFRWDQAQEQPFEADDRERDAATGTDFLARIRDAMQGSPLLMASLIIALIVGCAYVGFGRQYAQAIEACDSLQNNFWQIDNAEKLAEVRSSQQRQSTMQDADFESAN